MQSAPSIPNEEPEAQVRSDRFPKQVPQSQVSQSQVPQALGPGLHAGWPEQLNGEGVRVRMMNGAYVTAAVGDGVDPLLVEECLRASQLMILADGPRGPMLLGALQTTRSLVREPDGTVAIEAKRIELRAEQDVRLQAGPTRLDLQRKRGKVQLRGERMKLDMSSHVRVLSSLVELP